MPKKERPSPLADSIFTNRLQSSPGAAVNGEIPVINTFIQFGDPAATEQDDKSLSTAPAWIGPSLQSIMQTAVETQAPIQEDSSPAKPKESSEPIVAQEPEAQAAEAPGQPVLSELPSPKKISTAQFSVSEAKDEKAAEEPQAESNEPKAGEDGAPPEVDERAIALAESGDIPSVGSFKHDEGLCKRCCFFPKGRCLNGSKCEFCHYEHEKRKRKKKKKNKTADGMAADGSDSEEGDVEAVAIVGEDSGQGVRKLPLTAPPPEPPRLPHPVMPQAHHHWDGYDGRYEMGQYPMPNYGPPPYDMGYGPPPFMPEYMYPPAPAPWAPAVPPPPATAAVTSGYSTSQNGIPLPPPR